MVFRRSAFLFAALSLCLGCETWLGPDDSAQSDDITEESADDFEVADTGDTKSTEDAADGSDPASDSATKPSSSEPSNEELEELYKKIQELEEELAASGGTTGGDPTKPEDDPAEDPLGEPEGEGIIGEAWPYEDGHDCNDNTDCKSNLCLDGKCSDAKTKLYLGSGLQFNTNTQFLVNVKTPFIVKGTFPADGSEHSVVRTVIVAFEGGDVTLSNVGKHVSFKPLHPAHCLIDSKKLGLKYFFGKKNSVAFFTGPFKPGCEYQGTISADLPYDKGWETLGEDYTWTFKVRPDTLGPHMKKALPMEMKMPGTIPLDTKVEFSFSELMDVESVRKGFKLYRIRLQGTCGPSPCPFNEMIQLVPGQIEVKNAHLGGEPKHFIFTPTMKLEEGYKYSTWLEGPTDIAGNPLTKTTWSFRTVGTPVEYWQATQVPVSATAVTPPPSFSLNFLTSKCKSREADECGSFGFEGPCDRGFKDGQRLVTSSTYEAEAIMKNISSLTDSCHHFTYANNPPARDIKIWWFDGEIPRPDKNLFSRTGRRDCTILINGIDGSTTMASYWYSCH